MAKDNTQRDLRFVADVTKTLLTVEGVRTATKFIDRNTVIRAHRISYGGRIDKRDKAIDLRIKIGKPNYHEREFIKDCVAAGEPFPVKNIRLSYFRSAKE